MAARDVVIIGAGINGLVAAWRLAAAGCKPLVLEARPRVGGAAITEEFYPGFRCSTLAHAGWASFDGKEMEQLKPHGLKPVHFFPSMCALSPEGRALLLFPHPDRSAESIAAFSGRDAARYPAFHRACTRMARVLAGLRSIPPPSLDEPSPADLWNLLRAGRSFRGLGKTDMLRLLRWVPMAVADFVEEWFEADLLQAALAARGIFGSTLGPMSAGSTAIFLLRTATEGDPAGAATIPQGGMGALTEALAGIARQAGAEIRTGAAVARIQAKDGGVTGVVLADGEEISATTVVSNADPKRTLLDLVDPVHLEPTFIVKLQHYRCAGTLAKVNLALDSLPTFPAADAALQSRALEDYVGRSAVERAGPFTFHPLAGRIHIGPSVEYLERAFDASKYGRFSEHPVLEVLIPSVADPSLAPAGKHVMSIYAQFAPYRLRDGQWPAQREALGDAVLSALAEYAPSLPNQVLHRQVITPLDLHEQYGLTGGQIFHGELALDQLFTMRPLLGWARYRTPVRGLYLCGSGAHPGPGFSGDPGANAAREILRDLRARR